MLHHRNWQLTPAMDSPGKGTGVRRTLLAMACLVAALLPAAAASGQETILGLAIDGEGQVGIGTDQPGSALDVVGDINARGDVFATGDIFAGGGLSFFRTYKRYTLSETQDNASKSLGPWDLCFLSKVKFAGIDRGSGDWASCEVKAALSGSIPSRLPWFLYAKVRDDADKAECAAICMSFTGQCTGASC